MRMRYMDIPLVVEYDYQPEEKETLHHPPIAEEVDLLSCVVVSDCADQSEGQEIIDLLSAEAVNGIEREILNIINEEEE